MNDTPEKPVRRRQADKQEICPGCGLMRRELYEQGHMGCARCYGAFGAEVRRALQEIHGAIQHIGKS